MKSRTASLHIELPKIFGPQILEILFQLLGGHLLRRFGQSFRRSLAFLEQERREEILLSVDRRFESEGDGDAVGWTRVDMNRAGIPRDVKLRVKGRLSLFISITIDSASGCPIQIGRSRAPPFSCRITT